MSSQLTPGQKAYDAWIESSHMVEYLEMCEADPSEDSARKKSDADLFQKSCAICDNFTLDKTCKIHGKPEGKRCADYEYVGDETYR